MKNISYGFNSLNAKVVIIWKPFNQLIGFYMIAVLAFDELNTSLKRVSKH